MKFTKGLAFTLVATAALASCGGSPATKSPGFFSYRIVDGSLVGRYNPAGYDAPQVARLIKSSCNENLEPKISTAPSDDGLVAFTAVCAKGAKFTSGAFEVERKEGGG